MEKNRVSIKLDSEANSMQIKEVILFAVLIGTLATLLSGYQYGFGDQTEQRPQIFRQLDSSYLTQDFFVNATAGFGPRFYYSKFLAMLGSYCPMPILYLLLTLISNILIVFTTFLVARNLFHGSNLTAMMACILVMTVHSLQIGPGGQLYLTSLKPASLASPFAYLSLWAGIKRRPIICGVLSAFASIIHPTVGLEIGAIGLATAGLSVLLRLDNDNEHSPQRTFIEMGKVVAGVIVLGVFATFAWVIPYYSQATSSDPMVVINIYGYFRGAHTTVPSSFGIRPYIALLCFLLAFAVSWKWWHDDASTDKTLARRILIPIIIVLLMFIGGYLFVEVFPSRLWVIAQIFRLTQIVLWLGLIVLAGTIARFLKRNDAFEKSYSGWLLLISSLGHPLFMFLGHIVEILRERLKSLLPPRGIHLVLGIAMIASIGLIGLGSTHEAFTLLLFVAISFCFLLLPRRWYRSFIPVLSLCVVILIFAVNRYYKTPFLSRYLDKLQPTITLSDVKDYEYTGVADYARENIREDAIFLTPALYGGDFRIRARRAIVVDFKAPPPRALVEWRKRLLDCYGEVESRGFQAAREMNKLYKDITTERILSVAKKYGASHALLYQDTPSEFPVLFENELYKIVKIPAEGKLR